MSERIINPEVERNADSIAFGLEHWLMKEIGNATTGRNHYLDDFAGFHHSLTLPYDAEHNDTAQKNRSHHNRLVEWTNQFTGFYDQLTSEQKDFVLARQVFCAQMYLSGLFRIQCLLQASDQNDYYARRLNSDFIGIDLRNTLLDKLSDPDKVPVAELAKRTLSANLSQQSYIISLHETGRFNVGKEDSSTIDRNLELQKKWTNLIVDYVLFAAKERDGLEKVPFLEPKSISDDPQVYYPFANAS